MGRFINADAYAATGQGLLGNNMFAYCNNNPVMCYDPTGHAHVGIKPLTLSVCDGGGSYIGPPVTVYSLLMDYIYNEDENEVLNADYLAFYKGVPVVKVPAMGYSAFSFGVIFMGSEVKKADLVRHEYGHIKQLHELGISDYSFFVVLPSVVGYNLQQSGLIPYEMYYNQPWEYIADIYGQVSWDHAPWAGDLAKEYWDFVKEYSPYF